MERITRMFFRRNESKQKSKHILIIDGDSKNRKFLSAIARKRGYSIFAEQGEKVGYEAAKDKLPNLIIIGAVIAGKKSIDLCGKLKNNSKTKHIPILVLAESMASIKSIEYYDKGVDFFLTSPISESDLLKQIEILIEK